MARVRMVTRTINVTVASCVFMDMETYTTVFADVEINGAFDNVAELTKTLEKMPTSNFNGKKFVAVKSYTTNEEIYGMLESEFLKVAKKLDEDRHFIAEAEETDEE